MDFDLQLPLDSAFPNVGAVLVLLLIVRQPSHSGCEVIEVFMDPLLFLNCCAGLLHHLARKTLLNSPDIELLPQIGPPQKDRKEITLEIPAISIEKIGVYDNEIDGLISRAKTGLALYEPELCTEGVNGTYFIKGPDGKIIAVFKPEDEELSSPNNPKAQQEDSKRGILPGEAAARELMASRINDQFDDFFAVPRTCMVKMTHPSFGEAEGRLKIKIGSLQEFVDNDGSAGDVGPSIFPVEQVHRIALLDLLLHNTDRHEGNILYRSTAEGVKLTPIDHGFSLPDKLGGAWFDWMHYPQAKKDFSGEILDVVERLQLQMFSEESTGVKIRPECMKTLELSLLMVKEGVRINMTPRQMGVFASRRNPKEISQFEALVKDAENMTGDFMENVSRLLKERLPAAKI